MYAFGFGVSENPKIAFEWYAKAQSNLGVMYANGEGVFLSNIKAYMWWNLAAFNGNEKAGDSEDTMSNEQWAMSNEQIGKAQGLSEACLAKD